MAPSGGPCYCGNTIHAKHSINVTMIELSPAMRFGRGAKELISKHLYCINLVQGNLLHTTIFVSNIKVNV